MPEEEEGMLFRALIWYQVKFRYSEKATNLKKSSTYNLMLLSSIKFYVEDFFKFCGYLRISEL